MYEIEAYGARGGFAFLGEPRFPGGDGASAQGMWTLTRGTVLNVVVGQYGGKRSRDIVGQDSFGGGGGGGTFVWLASAGPADPPLLAAGGGGGATYWSTGTAAAPLLLFLFLFF